MEGSPLCAVAERDSEKRSLWIIVEISGSISVCSHRSADGCSCAGDKYFAIPWNAFSFNLPMSRVVLNIEKKLLEKAPGFDKDNWPNMADATWGAGIHQHYGLTPYWGGDLQVERHTPQNG